MSQNHITKISTNSNKIWVKLSHEDLRILDKFYRDLSEGSARLTSIFIVNMYHRSYKGYYEFYEMEFNQIYDGHSKSKNVYSENKSINLFFKDKKELEQLKLLY